MLDLILTVLATANKFPSIIPPLSLGSILSVSTEVNTFPLIVFLISYCLSSIYKSESLKLLSWFSSFDSSIISLFESVAKLSGDNSISRTKIGIKNLNFDFIK